MTKARTVTVATSAAAYIASQPARIRNDMDSLHSLMSRILLDGRRWFLDGTDDRGRVVSNPSVGYGEQTTRYADGSTKPFYQIGFSANTAGLSVYVMGLPDRTYLPATYGATLGKATVTGYCIKFKSLAQIDMAVLEVALRDGVARTIEL